MDFDPHSLLEGIAIAAKATQCDVAYIFIRGEFHLEAKIMERALTEAYEKRIFGQQGIFGSDYKLECYVHRGAAPTSAAKKPACSGPGRQARLAPQQTAVPRHRRGFARPTVINNVETSARPANYEETRAPTGSNPWATRL